MFTAKPGRSGWRGMSTPPNTAGTCASPPILHNLHGDGHSWKNHSISRENVLDVNSRIEKGSKSVWRVIEAKLNEAAESGLLK